MAIIKHIHKDPAAKKRADHMRHQHARLMRVIGFTPYDPYTGKGRWDRDLLYSLLVRVPHLCDNPFVIGWCVEWYGSNHGLPMLNRARCEGAKLLKVRQETSGLLARKQARHEDQQSLFTHSRFIDLED